MSTLQFDGLVSGLQTSQIIQQMMAIERRPLSLMQQKQTVIQQRSDTWRDMAMRIQNLEAAISPLMQRNTLAGNKVSFTTTNPPLTAVASADAVPGKYAVLISRLATSTVAKSTAPMGAEINSADKLSAINFSSAVTAGTFTINGVAINVDPVNDSLDDMVTRINGAGAGVTASINLVDGRKRMELTATAAGGEMQLGSGADTSNFLSVTKLLAAPRSGDTITGTGNLGVTQTKETLANARMATPVTGPGVLTINNVDISYDPAKDSLGAVINRINTSSAGVTASYDAHQDRMILQNKQTGSVTIAVSDTGTFLTATGLDDSTSQTLGDNAEYSLDGGATTRYSGSNIVKDAISGVTLTFTATSTTAAEFSVGPDSDKAVNAVKRFVDQYNSAMTFLREKMAYNSTTKKAGTLTGDATARMLERSLRQLVVNPAVNTSSPLKTLGEIGVSFGSFGSSVGTTNDLKLDETKLRAALQDNPNAVVDLLGATHSAAMQTSGDIASFFGTPKDPPASGRYEITSDGAGNLTATFIDTDGVVRSTATGTITADGTNSSLVPGLTLQAGSTLTGATTTIDVTYRQGSATALQRYVTDLLAPDGALKVRRTGADNDIKRLDTEMQRLTDRITQKEQRLVRQFASLERVLSQLQGQSNALSSQLMGLMGSQN